MTAAESCDVIVLGGGTAGCLPLTTRSYDLPLTPSGFAAFFGALGGGAGTPSSIAKTAAVAVCVEARKSPSQG
jgi:hypothetical protein